MSETSRDTRAPVFPLVTPRLSLRPVAAEDIDALLSLYSDWEVARWLSRLAWPFTSDSAMTMISEAMTDLERTRGYFLRIDSRTSGTFVGTLSLRLPAYDDEPWTTDTTLGILGYALVPQEHGRGFATEAAARMVEFAFVDVGLQRLRATALRDNIASRRVLERLGFRIRHTDVREVARGGGPPRLGDTYMLERDYWRAVQSNRRPNLGHRFSGAQKP
jgi:RimJ/RimL family protein N-acetyltransferase